MQNFMKTILSAMKTWTKKEINKVNNRIMESTADWNENDSSKDSYVKNRTHWDETINIIKERTVSDFYLMENGIYVVENPFKMKVDTKETYMIMWDNNTYYLKVQNADGLYCIGNINYAYMEPGGDIPFAIIFAGPSIFLATESTEYSHKIAIYTGELHKLDSKYLPDNLATTDSVQATIDYINAPKDYIILNDVSDGLKYKVRIKDGVLITSVVGSRDDFNYISNSDGTYTISGWKNTYWGNPSTEMIIPDDNDIIL